jgi:flagella basal body P-ring formation protein FlgA
MKTHCKQCRSRTRANLGALALLPLTGAVGASGWQDAGSIQAVAESTAREQFSTTAGMVAVNTDPLDPRLRMPACDQALSGSLPNASQETGRVTVEVRCPGSRPWRLFVPVRVTVEREILVAAAPLERGKVLAADDVLLTRRDAVATPGGYLTTAEAAVGQVLRRSVPAGTVLSPALLDAPVLIRRGQTVTLEARSGPITVQMAGVARADGALGQTIGVENTSSKKVLQGIVRNEKSVEVMVP